MLAYYTGWSEKEILGMDIAKFEAYRSELKFLRGLELGDRLAAGLAPSYTEQGIADLRAQIREMTDSRTDRERVCGDIAALKRRFGVRRDG